VLAPYNEPYSIYQSLASELEIVSAELNVALGDLRDGRTEGLCP